MALETVALAASIGGAAAGAYGSLYTGAATKAAADYNADIANRNAGIARDQAATDAADKAREGRRYLGALHAAFGASGLAMEGSALDLYEDQALDIELAKKRILYGGELRALGLSAEADLQGMKGEAASSAALIGAASYGLKGVGSYAMWQDEQNRTAATALGRAMDRDYRLRRP